MHGCKYDLRQHAISTVLGTEGHIDEETLGFTPCLQIRSVINDHPGLSPRRQQRCQLHIQHFTLPSRWRLWSPPWR